MYATTKFKLTKVADHSAAATSAINSSSVDMVGYEGCVFFTSFGTAAANNTINAAQSSDDAVADAFADLEGTSVSSGTSDEDVFVEVYRPVERYVRCEVARGTSTTCESIWCLQYGARNLPVDNTTSGTITGETHASPDEGTA